MPLNIYISGSLHYSKIVLKTNGFGPSPYNDFINWPEYHTWDTHAFGLYLATGIEVWSSDNIGLGIAGFFDFNYVSKNTIKRYSVNSTKFGLVLSATYQ